MASELMRDHPAVELLDDLADDIEAKYNPEGKSLQERYDRLREWALEARSFIDLARQLTGNAEFYRECKGILTTYPTDGDDNA